MPVPRSAVCLLPPLPSGRRLCESSACTTVARSRSSGGRSRCLASAWRSARTASAAYRGRRWMRCSRAQSWKSTASVRRPRTLCPFGRCRFLPLGRRVPSLRHIAHDCGGGLTRLRQRERGARAQRHPPFLTIKRVLAKIGSAAAGRHAHGKPALRIIKNEPVFSPAIDEQRFDFSLGQLHRIPDFVRRSALGLRTRGGPHRMAFLVGWWRSESESLREMQGTQ
jgi:hypothetical protein